MILEKHPVENEVLLKCQRASRVLAGIVFLIAVLALFGWFFHLPFLSGVFFGLPPMRMITSFCLILISINLFYLSGETKTWVFLRLVSHCVVLGIALLTIGEYLYGWQVSIDLIIPEGPGFQISFGPGGRMALLTAFNFVLLSCSFLVRTFKKDWYVVWELLALIPLFLDGLALLGYVYDAKAMMKVFAYQTTSVTVAIATILISIAIMLESPQLEFTATYVSPLAGGKLGRVFLMGSAIAILGIGLIARYGQIHGLYDANFAVLVALILSFLVKSILIWWNARQINAYSLSLTKVNESLSKTNEALELKVLERTRDFNLKAEAARKSEQEFRDIFQLAMEGIFVSNLDGDYIDVNRAAEELLGYSRKELLGKNIRDLIPAEEIPRFDSLKKKMLEPGSEDVGQWHMRHKSGLYIEVEVMGKIYPDKRWMAFVRDISISQNALRRLSFLSEISQVYNETLDFYGRLQKTAESLVPLFADFCIMEVFKDDKMQLAAAIHRDPEQSQTLVQAAQKITNIRNSGEELESIRAGDLVYFEDIHFIQSSMEKQVSKYLETWLSLDIVSYIAIPLRARTKTIGLMTLARTDARKKFDEEDFIFAKAVAFRCGLACDNARLFVEALNAVRDREHLLSVVSHDLKNPLFAVAMASKNLREDSDSIDPRVGKNCDIIENSVSLMQKLISDLLDFGKIEAGTLTVNPEPVSISDIVEFGIEAIRLAAKEKFLDLKIEAQRNIPKLYCEKSRLIQVLWNLLGNAIKFTPKGGLVTLKVEPEQDFVKFSVIDSGPGIQKEDLSLVFERFWQAKETKSLGSGLGLAISKWIVEAHGGQIWVESQLGVGTQLFFTIPIFKDTQNQPAKLVKEKLTLKDHRILLVDDSDDIRILMRKLLEREGAFVVEAGTGAAAESALIEFANISFDVIITDIEMPVENGFELLKKIRHIGGQNHIPVIALTGYSAPIEYSKIMEAGFDACFTKPVPFEKLRTKIESLIQKRRTAPESDSRISI